MGWNVRGKSLEALQEAWDLLNLEDMDFICLQELGGLGAEPGSFGRTKLRLGHRDFVAFICTPQGGFRGLAILVPAEMAVLACPNTGWDSQLPLFSSLAALTKT